MRALFMVGAISAISMVCVVAQEAGRTGNSSNTGQTGQVPSATGQREGGAQNPNAAQERNRRESTKNSPEEADRNREGRRQNVGNPQLEHFFVSCLRDDNRGEVEIAKLAAQRATNPEVKAFAQQMIKDHSEFLAKLDRLSHAGTQPAGTSAESRRPDAANPAATNRGDAKSETRRTDSPPADASTQRAQRGEAAIATTAPHGGDAIGQLTQIKKEISEKCLASLQRELSDKQGKEFDKCYMGAQVGAHMHMVDTLSVLSRHVSGELQQVVSEGQRTAQQHLDHAKQIAKQLDQSPDSTPRTTDATRPTKSTK